MADVGERKPSVLIVDDTEANLFTLEALLEDMPCTLVRASSGNDALRQLLKRSFALILLDVRMPDMDGYEVARHVRENPNMREVPIIFLTAEQRGDDGELRAYGSGAVDFLLKPFNATILRGKVRVFLELHAARQRLAETADELRSAQKELEAFSYSVSHDLRAPLRAIDGFSAALLEDSADRLDDRGKEQLHRVRAAAARMGQLIADLLELSRVGRGEVARTRVDLTQLARGIAASLAATSPARRVDIQIQDGLVAEGDPGLLAAALENLIGNAWKFTSKTSDARIEVGSDRRAGEAWFFVRDNGAGFDMTFVEKLFRPFQRLHSDAAFPGTGIGLATVQRIVARHGGRISAEGRPGEGATFRFTLPGARGKEPS